MISFKSFLDAFTNALFPQRCIVCNKLSEDGYFFCKNCKGKMEIISDKLCRKCGSELKKCDCDRFIYHFDGAVSPFANDGQAKEVFYSFKFGSNFAGTDYFAEQMVSAFNQNFSDVKIDLICFVPLSKSQLKEREIDKCELLAGKVAEIMQIPLKSLIVKREGVPTQHKLNLDSRFDNVQGAYKVTEKVKNKNILLIDDIKTTGATLDACAKELKFAGASAVYCLTVLSGKSD